MNLSPPTPLPSHSPFSRSQSKPRLEPPTTSTSFMNPMDEQVARVQEQFPQADPGYLRHCLSQHGDQPIERLIQKMVDINRGHYPTLPARIQPNSVSAKNLAMKKIVRLFPEVDLAWLRGQLNQQDHSHVYAIIDRMADLDSRPGGFPRRLLTRQQPQNVARLARNREPSTTRGRDQDDPIPIKDWEYLRTEAYIKGARYQLYNTFPNIWKSTIKAVMAENNNDYVRTHDRLNEMEATNHWTRWLGGLFSFIHRPAVSAAELQLGELLQDVDVIAGRARKLQSEEDKIVAKKVNEDEYERHGQLIECGCCFSDCCFEDLVSCQEGHLFCKDCLVRYVQEGLFGQGALRGQTIKCIEGGTGCDAFFSDGTLEASLSADLYQQYTTLLIDTGLKQSGLHLVLCPFCNYCEVEDTPTIRWPTWGRLHWEGNFGRMLGQLTVPLLLSILYGFGWVLDMALLVLMLPFIMTMVLHRQSILDRLETGIQDVIRRIQQRSRGNIFTCQNCAVTSCLKCRQECKPLHKCYENVVDGLRLHVEKAMADAVKRTCPECLVSFTKESGCNKMTCRCGYQMCYICRRDIRKEGYQHFCGHFRAIVGQTCKECTRCDLYKTEDEEALIQKAAQRAKDEYMKAHPTMNHVPMDQVNIGPAVEGHPLSMDRLVKLGNGIAEWMVEMTLMANPPPPPPPPVVASHRHPVHA